MLKAIATGLFIASLSAPCVAQHPAARSAVVEPDSTVKKFAGMWEGSFSSDHASGGMRVALTHDSAWKASVTFVVQEPMSSDGTNVKIEGNRVSWSQEVMGMSCDASATLVGAVLKGDVNCGQAKISFELRRRE